MASRRRPNRACCRNVDCMAPDMRATFDVTIKDKHGSPLDVMTTCQCVLPPTPPPPSGPVIELSNGGSLNSNGTASMSAGVLNFTGDFVTGSSFASDPIVGAPVSVSGSFNLVGTGTAFGVNVAQFFPASTASLTVGSYFSGTVEGVQYNEELDGQPLRPAGRQHHGRVQCR